MTFSPQRNLAEPKLLVREKIWLPAHEGDDRDGESRRRREDGRKEESKGTYY